MATTRPIGIDGGGGLRSFLGFQLGTEEEEEEVVEVVGDAGVTKGGGKKGAGDGEERNT